MPVPDSILDRLRDIVGPQGHLDAAGDIEPFLTDHRKLYRGATPLVLRPDSTARISEILKLCNAEDIGVVPVGGNTSYCGGATPSPDGSQIVVSLARLRRIRKIDPLNFTLTAEAGCVLAEIQAAAEAHDMLFPLSLGSEGSCQLGGNLSTNAGGTAVLRYGMARDLVLGLEVVLPDGRVLENLGGLRKDNTGYDLRNLFIGAEGTLGIITAASCKLFPRPHTVVTALVAVRDPDAAVELLAHLRQTSGDAVTTFELIPRMALDFVLRHIGGTTDPFRAIHAWYVLAEAGTSRVDIHFREELEAALASAQERGILIDAAIAQSDAQRDALWRLRESIPEAQGREGAGIKHDVAVMISDIAAFIREGTVLCLDVIPQGRVVSYGHLGDGSLHFNITQPVGGDRTAFLAAAPELNRRMHDLTSRYGGSFSAEHGIGQLKREELKRYESAVAIDLMRTLKQAIDPRGIMNPGKVL